MNAFILDFKLLEEQQLSIEGYLSLLTVARGGRIYNDSDRVIKELESLGFIKKISDDVELREKGLEFINFISIEDVVRPPKKSRKKVVCSAQLQAKVESFINEYRALFKGLKPGSMGDSQACKNKMIAWMTNNPQYTPEDILKATKAYLKSVNNVKYLKEADNFIYKLEGGFNKSVLLSFVEDNSVDHDDEWAGSQLI